MTREMIPASIQKSSESAYLHTNAALICQRTGDPSLRSFQLFEPHVERSAGSSSPARLRQESEEVRAPAVLSRH